jgi:prepilin-type N-terminal cleavage/methylation domain-containing protein
MSDRGFTLTEVLIACALTLVLTSAIVSLAVPLRDSFERSIGAADLTGGSRAVLDQISAEIREAGSGASVTAGTIDLGRVQPSAVVLPEIDSIVSAPRGRAVRLTRVPLLTAQGTLRVAAATGAVVIQLDTDRRCHDSGAACGFRAGTEAIVHDAAGAVNVTVDSVSADGIVRLARPLSASFTAGAVMAAVSVITYGVRDEGGGSFRLVRVSSGSEQPLLQNVVDFEVSARGVDALRIQQIDFRLRVEAAAPNLRGPAGRLFRRAGTARKAGHWVPDVEVRASVATRNLPN